MKAPFLNAVRMQALRTYSDKVLTRTGSITGYDPLNYVAKVLIEPEGILTGWLRICSPWSGSGWGMFAPPHIGAQVEIVFEDGDMNAGFIEGRFFNSTDLPVPVDAGEFLLQHESGSCFKFNNDGSVTLQSDTDLALVVGGSLTATVAGDINLNAAGEDAEFTVSNLKVNGTLDVAGESTFEADVEVQTTLTGNKIITQAGIDLDTHLTSGVTSGTSNSSVPVP